MAAQASSGVHGEPEERADTVIHGLNNKLTGYRPLYGPDDAVGGAVQTGTSTVYRNVLCRVDNPRGSRREQMMEIDIARAVNIVVWPATYVFQVQDEVEIESGRFADQRFLVFDIKEDSLVPTHPNAHIELTAV